MKYAVILTSFFALLTAQAGYLPPPDSPYWCYVDCIDPHHSNHSQCVDKCFGSRIMHTPQVECSQNQELSSLYQHMAAACCSWGENIKGCMPGC